MRLDLPTITIPGYGDAAICVARRKPGADGVYGEPIYFAALKVEIDERLAAHGLPRITSFEDNDLKAHALAC